VDESRKIVQEGKLGTTAKALDKVFGKKESMTIAIEASTKSFWVADQLRALGHNPVVVDPGRTKAIGAALIKHDKLDARVLATLCAAKVMAPVDQPSREQRVRRMPVVVRDGLVRSRARLMNVVMTLLDSEGYAFKKSAATSFTKHVRAMKDEVDEAMWPALTPILKAIDEVSGQIEICDEELRVSVENDKDAQLLMTVPGVGPIVVSYFIMAVRDPGRFRSGRQVGAYLGLVPSLYESGTIHRRGHITKYGNRQARWALTIAANVLLSVSDKSSSLKTWGEKLALKIGRKKAKVAVARKLSAVLWSMWKHQKPFDPKLPLAA
jgi:transposase